METLVSRPFCSQRDARPAIDLVLKCRAVEAIDPWPPIYDLCHRLRTGAQQDAADTQIWEHRSGELAAVATIWDGMTLIFAIHPHDLNEELMGEILCWGLACARALARRSGEQPTLLAPICADDRVAAALLERQGWIAEDWSMLRMVRSLGEPIAMPALPPGCVLRAVNSARDLAAATALYQDVFVAGSSIVHDRLALQRASDGVRAIDMVAVAPDGTFAAFCLCTAGPLDPTHSQRKEGWIDLIGTGCAHRRHGLGRAVLLAGLQQLQALGAERALLGTASWNSSAQHLFASAGFGLLHQIRWYVWTGDS